MTKKLRDYSYIKLILMKEIKNKVKNICLLPIVNINVNKNINEDENKNKEKEQ